MPTIEKKTVARVRKTTTGTKRMVKTADPVVTKKPARPATKLTSTASKSVGRPVRKSFAVSSKNGLSGQDLAALVASAAQEHKVSAPVTLNLTGLSSVADWFFIASAENSRQIRTVAEKIVRRAREAGVKALGQEGLETHWALVDLGDVVAHIFHPEARAVFDLESLWADAPRLE